MPRNPERAKCTPEDFNQLETIINSDSYSASVKKRALCIRLNAEGKVENQEIATEVGLSPYMVTKWIQRFNQEGIQGLFDRPRSGRKGGKPAVDLAGSIQDKLAEEPPAGEEKWTAETLSDELGVSQNSIRNAVRDSAGDITLGRERQWSFDTCDEVTGREAVPVALFIGKDEYAFVLSVSRKGVRAEGTGRFTTRNKDLAEEIRAFTVTSSRSPSLSELLSMASRHVSDNRRFGKASLGSFINRTASDLPKSSDTVYFVIAYTASSTMQQAVRHSGFSFTLAPTRDEWLGRVDTFLDIYGVSASDAAALKKALRTYLDVRNDKTEAFAWRKQVTITDHRKDSRFETGGNGSAESHESKTETAEGDGGNASDSAFGCITFAYTNKEGKSVSASIRIDGVPDSSECDLSSRESVAEYYFNLSSSVLPGIDRLTELIGQAVGMLVKSETVMSFEKSTFIETRMGRIPITVTGELARSLHHGERLKTRDFLAIEQRLASLDPYTQCNDLMNLIARRCSGNNNLIMRNTEYEDTIRTGASIIEKYNQIMQEILRDSHVTINEAGGIGDHSDIDGAVRRIEVSQVSFSSSADCDEDMGETEKSLHKDVASYNSRQTKEEYKISGDYTFEISSQCCYICVDDVLVHRQDKVRMVRKNGRWAAGPDLGPWIYHSVGYIEADKKVYMLEADSQPKVYSLIYAFLLHNGLTDRYLVFFMDGEETLKTEADRVFADWPHEIHMDYYHLEERMKENFSRAFKPGKIIDDTVEPERFKNGKIKKSSLVRLTRSKYYLRHLMSMLWAGNIQEASDWLASMLKSGELKSGGDSAIQACIDYLEAKKDRIPCYALRHMLGLRNTSNSVEISNNVLVARRQKSKGMTWNDAGSFSCSVSTALFVNEEAENYFKNEELSFNLRSQAQDRKYCTWLEWVNDPNVELHITSELKELELQNQKAA